ncbi:RNA polymerase subunit sigma-70 [Allorhizocola rhizosphaerae]|uniref:RNA polymerase subunit sigma-70 n=1 Tax=Allorhizocola rhizosphaerae TaxID=1872709 RepID=UPI000E3B8FA6|nr:RNA polymerase subunit sigma-70 [Allorhizocola rhizosphaerae]
MSTTTFDELERYRGELTAHCYRMLGSLQDAEDAVQETLISAWRGLDSFEGRSSLRTWLYRIATHACIRLGKKRIETPDYGPPWNRVDDLGEPAVGQAWLEPFPSFERRESVELAFVAALQHLPANQRAVLILRDVLEFSAAEVAQLLDTTPVSVNSALQRARKTVHERVPPVSQQAELAALGDAGQRELVRAFVTAWESSDVDSLVGLLADDARFTMPPLPAWFAGRDMVARFFAERVFATPWRLRPASINAQLGFVCYQGGGEGEVSAVNVLSLRAGKITRISAFIDPDVRKKFAAVR